MKAVNSNVQIPTKASAEVVRVGGIGIGRGEKKIRVAGSGATNGRAFWIPTPLTTNAPAAKKTTAFRRTP
jgi:hypothetical protein